MLIWAFKKKISISKNKLKGTIKINGEEIIGDLPGISCSINFKNSFSLLKVIFEGDIGLGKEYRDNNIQIENLTDFFRFCVQNEEILGNSNNKNPLNKIIHFFKRNSLENSEKNIQDHYDIGNDFYKLWLDNTLSYSSAYWGVNEHLTLEDAQKSKIQLYLNNIKEEDSILEVGAGWGGIAKALKENYNNINYLGLSLSNEQTEVAKNYGNVIIQDYRNHKGKYDKIISIEMFEAVGKEYWDIYFEKLKECLNPSGIAQLQVITIEDKRYNSYKTNSDFIKHFIFPGGFLPTKSVFIDVANKNGFEEVETIEFPLDYARTLRCWRENFENKLEEVKKLGYDDKFIRIWRMYLCICEAGFMEGTISVQKTSFKLKNT